jgi:ERCC4-type nuclease
MILIDSRVGSAHYQHLIPNSTLTQLEFGDAAFEGNGITVGIEVKRLGDAINSMRSNRLADRQIPGMVQSYDIRYLIVEGLYRAEPGTGILQGYKGELGKWGRWYDCTSGMKRLMYDSFEKWLHSMTELSGTRLERTPEPEMTATLIQSLYNWWQRSDHHSFHVLDETTESAVLSRPTMNRRILALLPRIGWSRSGILAKRFQSVADMVAAPPEAWLIEREIGMDTAIKIREALHGA